VHALALMRLHGAEPPGPRRAQAVLRQVAARLGNTVAVCRKAYVHPAVLALAQTADIEWPPVPRQPRGLRLEERQLLGFLRTSGAP